MNSQQKILTLKQILPYSSESIELLKMIGQHQSKQYNSLCCPYSNKSWQLCLNEKCIQHSGFLCLSSECQCRKKHASCEIGQIKLVHQKIQQKVKSPNAVKEHIERIFDKIIDQLSYFRDDLLNEIQTSKKYSPLTEIETKFINVCQKGIKSEEYEMNGQQLSELWKSISSDNISHKYETLKQNLNKLSQSCSTSIILARNRTLFSQRNNKLQPQAINLYNRQLFEKRLVNQSFIIKKPQFAQRFINFIPKKIKNLERVFKASDEGFRMHSFYQKCGTMCNIIIVALTQKDKIFCGFTPFCFQGKKTQPVEDIQKQSFVFSLNQNQKFLLTNPECAIYRYSTQQKINFGRGSLTIHNYAQNFRSNEIGVPSIAYYTNPKYGDNKESHLKLNGTQQRMCLLKEWEAWKIQFQK